MLPPLQRLKKSALESAQPLTALLELTYRCNWRCSFCYNPRHADRTPLRADEWIGVLDGLRALGTFYVALSGGEPLAHPDVFPIAEAARARGFALRVFTNGSLVDGAVADRLAALNLLCVEVSLHGASAAVHDAATESPGSFDRLFRGIEALAARDVPLLVKTPITRLNEHQLDEMIALCASHGWRYQVDPNLQPRDDGDRGPLAYAPSMEVLRRLYARPELRGVVEPEERSAGGVNCGLGRMTLAIDPEGNVYPCAQWRHTALGNVRQAPLPEIWRTSAERARAADVARVANDRLLERGGAMASFPFCPAQAFQLTGDPLTPDAGTLAKAEFLQKLRAPQG